MTAENEKKRKRAVQIGRLDSIGGVMTELTRLYKTARRAEVDSLVASRLASILGELRRCLETSDLEKRLAELEAALGERPGYQNGYQPEAFGRTGADDARRI